MKIVRLIQIVIYSIVLIIVGSFGYKALFASGGGRSSSHPYGNLWLSYTIKNRGLLDPKVDWLVVTSDPPKSHSYTEDSGLWTVAFDNGREYSYKRDSKNLFWIDPESGVKKIPARLTQKRIQRIIDTRSTIGTMTFKSGEEFLAWIDGNQAQQAASSNR